MKNLPNFDEFLNESNIEMITGPSGLTKTDRELIALANKALPKSIMDRVAKIDAGGSWQRQFNTPKTVSKKGASYGALGFNVITLIFDSKIGPNKIGELIVGIRKRTSGPLTGYIGLKPEAASKDLIHDGVSYEYYNDEVDTLKELYDKEIAKFF